MKRIIFALLLTGVAVGNGYSADRVPAKSKVDFSKFLALSNEVTKYRRDRLVSLDRFNEMAAEKGTVILDTRSKSAYTMKHIKGAMHLNFSEFTEEKLAKLLPNKNTRILIYCNNNFKDDKVAFALKSPPLALNIPTFVNLYGYGYRNIYELKELVSIKDERLKLEGRSVALIQTSQTSLNTK